MAFNKDTCLKFANYTSGEVVTISIGKSPSGYSYNFSKDEGATWVNDSITLNFGEVAYCKGQEAPTDNEAGTTVRFSIKANPGMADPLIDISGSIMSLIDDGAGTETDIPDGYGFKELFQRQTGEYYGVILHEGLLPATGLTEGCYERMFNGTRVRNVPDNFLPATDLPQNCYAEMFMKCSLKKLPKFLLPASLENADTDCFHGMFKGNSGLKEIYFPFNTWYPGAAGEGKEYFDEWVSAVAGSGTFYCDSALSVEYGANRVPTGWTVKNTKSEIDTSKCLKFINLSEGPVKVKIGDTSYGASYYFTTDADVEDLRIGEITIPAGGSAYCLGSECSNYLGTWFKPNGFEITGGNVKLDGNITSLMNNGAGGDVNLDGTFAYLFKDQSNLTEITKNILPSKKLSIYAYRSLFEGTGISNLPPYLLASASSGTKQNCFMEMFKNCVNITTVPKYFLPFLNPPMNAFQSMFEGCTNLTKVEKDAMLATSLASKTCERMFAGCTKLKEIYVNFTEWEAMEGSHPYTTDWVEGVASEGTFTGPKQLKTIYDGNHYIPVGWEREPKPKMRGSLVFNKSLRVSIG